MTLFFIWLLRVVFISPICVPICTVSSLTAYGDSVHPRAVRQAAASLRSLPPNVDLANAQTMMCRHVTPLARRVEPNDEIMLKLFQQKQGSYVLSYMAATADEATEFPNMLEITAPLLTPLSQLLNLTIFDNYLAKKTIVSDLNKLQNWINIHLRGQTPGPLPTRSAADQQSTQPTSGQGVSTQSSTSYANITLLKNYSYHITSGTAAATVYPNLTTSSVDIQTTTATTTTTADAPSTTDPDSSASTSETTQLDNSYVRETHTSPPEHNTNTPYMTTLSPTEEGLSTTIDPDVAQSLQAFQNYLSGKTSDMDTIWHNVNTTVHPAQLIGLVPGSRRKKRNADGSTSQEQYCQMKGSMTDDGYLHMCKTCAVTTTLPEGHFPRYINEAVCAKDDNTCLTVGGTAHGLCKQRTFTLNLMRRKVGSCLVLNNNGSSLVLDDWELYPQPIRVCCECTINKLSVFSQYVAPSRGPPLG